MVSLASQKLLTQILKNAKSERNFNMKNYSSNEDMSKFTLKDAERGYFYYLFYLELEVLVILCILLVIMVENLNNLIKLTIYFFVFSIIILK